MNLSRLAAYMHKEQSKTFVWEKDWPEEDHSPNKND